MLPIYKNIILYSFWRVADIFYSFYPTTGSGNITLPESYRKLTTTIATKWHSAAYRNILYTRAHVLLKLKMIFSSEL